ncbi:SEC-C metal-binding domain-containing protein [Acinetobacter radioresistens]|uniref:SEC-C metal-binding domain-containing protein n=1 Tax=Acinetobacter radioresistens TaxID=40216 RepID=UPI0022479EC1|nr:SEC-C metal-binding domain-containing protein [Acinetobacter radioresistens]MCX0332458.1 SEC-C metal-binding domain-containing protein [Acinetobacter radioresistens]
MWTENEVFSELELLTSDQGFIEILAFLAFKDTYIFVEGETLDSESFLRSYDRTRLSKTELATLIALTLKNHSGNSLLSQEIIAKKSAKVYELFEKLHRTFYPTEISQEEFVSGSFFSSGYMMREAIFYSAEGAFKHQYRDISQIRYRPDNGWLKENKGFTIEELVSIISTIEEIQYQKANALLASTIKKPIESFLPIFRFNLQELVNESKLPLDTVEACLNTLLSYPKDQELNIFKSVDDFNYTNACPVIQIDDSYYTFSMQTLWESVYESPFFWFNNTPYNNQASKNRGLFTEHFTAQRLATIFGQENVFTNINLFRGSNKAGEIDVLVVFGELALIIQAKSKKLTIAARKGNSQQIEKDFQAAVEEAYKQAVDCSQLIQSGDIILKNETGDIVELPRRYKIILPICVVSDHYPALATQARQFLQPEVNNVIKHPFVTDVFLVDTITEMLPSPLHIFDYLIKRSDYGNSILLNHELSTLAIYIRQNLYFQEDFHMMMLDDNVTCDLELAMLARRDNLKDVPLTPDGLLTKFKDTHIGNLLDQVCFSKSYKLQQIGFHLLSLDEESLDFLNQALEKMLIQFNKDQQRHDVSIGISDSKTGMTIYLEAGDYNKTLSTLKRHIQRRKYLEKAQSWVGFCINPHTFIISIAIYENHEWQYSSELERRFNTQRLNNPNNRVKIGDPISFGSKSSQPIRNIKPKIGRNEPCPCGSGSKFKRCCGTL